MKNHVIRLSSKRQATFPADVCKELHLEPGDHVMLERREIEGASVWVLRTERDESDRWFGILHDQVEDVSHDIDAIRQSIGAARRRYSA